MSAVTINPSAVDAYLDRVRRFVENINKFQERLNHLLSGHVDNGVEHARKEQAAPQTMQTAYPYSEPRASMPTANAQKPVTPDEIDLDAMLNGINLNSGLEP